MTRDPKLLTALKIDEVSSCSAAANPGARVLITKRDDQPERTTPMSTTETIAKALTSAAAGRVSPYEVTQIFKGLADAAGMPLHQWYGTEDGKAGLYALTHLESVYAQTMNPLGDAGVSKTSRKKVRMEDNAHMRGGKQRQYADSTRDGVEQDDDENNASVHPENGEIEYNSKERAAKIDQLVKMRMAIGESYLEAVSKVHRAECGR